MTALTAACAVVAAYALGSIPFSLLLGYLLKGVDLRRHGSGNVGATNLGRVCGWRYFPLAFALDCAKGLAPLLLAGPYLASSPMPRAAVLATTVLLALAPVLGHLYSPFLGFRGGKGVATTAGALAAFLPLETAVVLAVWLLAFALTRTVGVASSTAALALPPAFFLCRDHPRDELLSYGALCLVLAAMVLYRHRSNLRQYFRR
jgi:acyl phosphate:glycerol-3-phosphate acyltransferase